MLSVVLTVQSENMTQKYKCVVIKYTIFITTVKTEDSREARDRKAPLRERCLNLTLTVFSLN